MTPVQKEEELRLLFSQWLSGAADESILRRLADYAADEEMTGTWHSLLADVPEASIDAPGAAEHAAVLEKVYQNLVAAEPALRQPAAVRNMAGWVKYAAAAVILLAAGALFYFFGASSGKEAGPAVVRNTSADTQSVATANPGKVVLTLSNGQQIILDTTGNGQLAKQSGSSIFKTTDGVITYRKEDAISAGTHNPTFNTVATGHGNDYKIVLPDGTAVWLNAASSITFPTAFTGSERAVTVEGEAYFEVTKNTAMPFRVKTNNVTIEVLGTHFNVNAYKDEPISKITLLEGSIRLTKGENSRVMKPGQQVQFRNNSNTLSLEEHADTEQAIAWKDGTFDFRNQDIETVMNQVSRWYNMTIVYNGKKPAIKILGMMNRNTDLNALLKSLALTSGIQFKTEPGASKDLPGKIIVQY